MCARTRWSEDLGQDLRYGRRVFRRSPAFALVAVLSLALGVGANRTIFWFVDAVLLKTLPVRDPERLVLLSERRVRETGCRSRRPPTRASQSDTLEGLCAFRPGLVSGSRCLRVRSARPGSWSRAPASPSLACRRTSAGCCSADDDAGSGGPLVAVISDAFWEQHFGGDGGGSLGRRSTSRAQL